MSKRKQKFIFLKIGATYTRFHIHNFIGTSNEEGDVARHLSRSLTTSERNLALDDLDQSLLSIAPNLPELRSGMWDTLYSCRADSARQAAHSA